MYCNVEGEACDASLPFNIYISKSCYDGISFDGTIEDSQLNLKDLDLRNQYRSDRHHLLADFYIPCLERSHLYDRAVGFFSSTSLALAAKGLSALILAGGRMRLIASPYLSEEDAAAIAQGLKQREDVITAVLLHELDPIDPLTCDRLSYLAWLLSKG